MVNEEKNKLLPRWARGLFDETAIDFIEKSINAAEQRTVGEIVPVLVRSSTMIGHVPFVIFLVLALMFYVTPFPSLIEQHFSDRVLLYVLALCVILCAL